MRLRNEKKRRGLARLFSIALDATGPPITKRIGNITYPHFLDDLFGGVRGKRPKQHPIPLNIYSIDDILCPYIVKYIC